MKKKFRIKRIYINIAIYIILIVVLILSLFIFVESYRKYQPFVISSSLDDKDNTLDNIALDINEKGIKRLASEEEISTLLYNKLVSSEKFNNSHIKDYYFDMKEGLSYFNLYHNNKMYSLVADHHLSWDDDNLNMSFKNFKMGKYKIRTLGLFYAKKLKVPNKVDFDFRDNNLIYLNNIEENDGELEIHYTYNTQEILKRFDSYKDNLDTNKINIYKNKDSSINDFVNFVKKANEASKEETIEWMNKLSLNRNDFIKYIVVLNDEGIKEACSDFKVFYDNSLDYEPIIEMSNNDINYYLDKYHMDFSKDVLNYLYVKNGYYHYDGSLMLNNVAISAEDILNNYGKAPEYGVELTSEEEGICASYKVGDTSISRIILRKE